MRRNDKKIDDKEKEDETQKELEKIRNEISEGLSDAEKNELDLLINMLNNKLKRQKSFINRIIAFIVLAIVNFVGFYLAYGIVYKNVDVTRLNALYLISALSIFKALLKVLLINIKNLVIRMQASVFSYGILILATYLFSNLVKIYHFSSFGYIILFYLVAFSLIEMISYTYTRISIMKMRR